MNLLRNLIALLLLASSTAALAQNIITLTVGFPPGGQVDMVARYLAMELKTTLGKLAIVNNVSGEMGARAVREFRGARADGSQILILAAFLTQPAPDLSGLVPVATIVGETGNYRWVGVFAPPGTPASIVRDLERAVMAALNSPGFNAGMTRFSSTPAGFTPAPGDGAQLARLVAQTPVGVATPPPSTVSSGRPTGTAPQARVPSGATSVSTDRSSASGGGWPAGVEPGNLYLVEYKYPSVAMANAHTLVAAKTRAEATALTESRWEANLARQPNLRGGAYGKIVFDVRAECTGPNWGAVVRYVPGGASGRERWGSACGAKTPREAILAATKACSTFTGTSCDGMENTITDTLIVSIGHSGAKDWSSMPFGGFPPEAMRFSALGATTGQLSNSYIKSPRDAINQFGKACGAAHYGKDTHSCWITSKNWVCLNSTKLGQQACVDTKLTAEGYLP